MKRDEKIERALRVMVSDPKILAWLKENDPKALEQANRALSCCGCGEIHA